MRTNILFFAFLAVMSCQEKEQWRNLFNGMDLSGWEVMNGTADYRVENDQIIGTTKAGTPNTFLATAEQYADFILEFEVRVDPAINSGVQFRSNSLPGYRNGQVHGYQCEIDPSERAWSGGVYDEGRRGWLYTLEENERGREAFRNNEWNQYRVEAVGDSIRIWVNDVNTANLVDSVTQSGFIALQVHSIGDDSDAGKEIRWRNIRILTEDPSAFLWIPVAPLISNPPGQYPLNGN